MKANADQLIIFDWDGTLMDSLSLIISAFQQAAEQARLPVPAVGVIKPLIGLGLPEAIRAAFDGLSLSDSDLQIFKQYYGEIYIRDSVRSQRLFAGVFAMLEALSSLGVRLAVATGKSRVGLERALDQSGVRHFVAHSRCADETCSKPDPMMIQQILTEADVDKANAIMIGDTSYDLDMAAAASVQAVGVAYGAHQLSVLRQSDPLHIAHSVEQLCDWLIQRYSR